MKHKESTILKATDQDEHPEWHPYSVWQREIRSRQTPSVVQSETRAVDPIEQTGTWSINVKNV